MFKTGRWSVRFSVLCSILPIGILLVEHRANAETQKSKTYYEELEKLADPFGATEFGQPMTIYALIERIDGTLRRALVSSFAIDALQHGKSVPVGSTFAVEVINQDGSFGFVDVRQKLAKSWEYGRYKAGSVDFTTRKAPKECDECHKQTGEGGPPFSQNLLERFALQNEIQMVRCDLGERAPCFSREHISTK